ncbi:MAG: hypothetical protein E6G94_13630 [Alphaproteobacteria bacterium]|nr:MAG: hypothetical protein E6G94_13630 [Alphaproteobacteria bacterium]
MTSEARPYASLSSGLLARKGGAKPAMRPAAFGQVAQQFEDLGWNDMGHAHDPYQEQLPNPVTGLTPAPGGRPRPHAVEESDYEEPPVVEQQRVLEAHFAPEPEAEFEPEAEIEEAPEPEHVPEPQASVVSLPAPRPRSRKPSKAAVPARAKSAFTLRLDAERHLKLRLACAVTGRSAQLLVTEAVDALLKELPEVDALARRVANDHGKRAG